MIDPETRRACASVRLPKIPRIVIGTRNHVHIIIIHPDSLIVLLLVPVMQGLLFHVLCAFWVVVVSFRRLRLFVRWRIVV